MTLLMSVKENRKKKYCLFRLTVAVCHSYRINYATTTIKFYQRIFEICFLMLNKINVFAFNKFYFKICQFFFAKNS